MFQTIYFDQKDGHVHAYRKFTKNMKKTKSDNLRRQQFVLSCRQVVCIIISNVQQYRWRCTRHWRLATQRPLLPLQNLLTASNHPHNSLSSCRCTLPFPVSPQTPWCQLHQHKPLSQPSNTITVLSLGSDSASSASSRALCFRISTRWLSVISRSCESSNSKISSALCSRI